MTTLDSLLATGVRGLFTTDIAGSLFHVVPGETGQDIIDLGKQRKIHQDTIERLHEIRNRGLLRVGITGMRKSSFDDAMQCIPLDMVILEHGGVLLDEGGSKEPEWEAYLKEQVEAVQAYKAVLLNEFPDEVIDHQGRDTSFRIKPEEQYTLGTIVDTLRKLHLPGSVKKEISIATPEVVGTYEIPLFDGTRMFLHSPYPPPYACIEVIPERSGKRNAVTYMLEKFSLGWKNVIAFGDDLNDQDMLEQAYFAATFAHTRSNHSREDLLRAVRSKGSGRYFITELRDHEGTREVLDTTINDAIPLIQTA